MRFSTVSTWLTWINTIHNQEIELGLDRVKEVASQLNLLLLPCQTISVAGTNGKGSTVAGLETIYLSAQYNVGVFTSPILFKYNEYVRINGNHPSDQDFCQVFEKIEQARKNIPLTPFEFHTLAALLLFQKQPLDIIILEVGLGGRLDAVNIIDADLAIITSIDLDHQEWLGNTREKIALEKAGIFRSEKPAIYGDFSPPQTLIHYANQLNTKIFFHGKEFSYKEELRDWSWTDHNIVYTQLPLPSLALENMSLVLMAITLFQKKLPVKREAIDQGLIRVNLPGRIHLLPGEIIRIFDVSHNPAAVLFLAKRLKRMACQGKTYAVFSMLADKDIVGSIKVIRDLINHWFCAPLFIKRGATKEELIQAFLDAKTNQVNFFTTLRGALQEAYKKAKPKDRIIVFGSFHTVAEAYTMEDNFF